MEMKMESVKNENVVSLNPETESEKSLILSAEEHESLRKYQQERMNLLATIGSLEEQKASTFDTLNSLMRNRVVYVKSLEEKYHLPAGVSWSVDNATRKIVFMKNGQPE
jgi:hypothetical protein